MFEQVNVEREVFGNGENLLMRGNVMALPQEIRDLAGQAQCVYLDPPFMTGEKFMRSRPYGEQGWKTGKPSPRYPAYDDRYTSEKEYLSLLRRLVGAARNLLRYEELYAAALRKHKDMEEVPYETCRQMVQDDLKTMHNPAKEVINEWSVYYFPHVFSEDYAAGWYDKVEAMQGKYDTFYAGEIMAFGDMDETAEYSRELVERFF